MSGNEEDKSEGNKIYPLDLASKITVKPIEVSKGTPIVMATQPLRRVLAQTVPNSGGSSAPTINIVPQAMIKQGLLSQSHSQSSTINVARPGQITLTTSVVNQPQTSTYHVPRGPATVANLARSAVATPIRAPGIVVGGSSQSGTFATTVRSVAPSRTPSPATGATWLSSAGIQLQNSQLGKNIISTGAPVTSGVVQNTINTNIQRISPVVSNPSTMRTSIVARTTQQQGGNISGATVTPAPTRQAVLHSAITIGGQHNQIQSFKSAGGLQAVTLAQVLPSHTPRAQTLVYSTGNSHFTQNPRIGLSGPLNTQRQVTTTRTNQIMATRLTVPVNVSQGATRLNVNTAQGGTIYTTGARLSAVPQTQSTVIGAPTNARLTTTPTNHTANLGRLATVSSSPGTLLTTSAARITVANQQPSAVVIGTQAGRLSASVVSLHPVVVANSAQNRTIQGSKVIAQPAQGPSLQLTQVPAVAKLPGQQSATVLPVPVTVAVATAQTTRAITVTPTAIVNQRPVAVTSGTQAIPIAKVFPQTNRVTLETAENVSSGSVSNPTNLFIHTAPVVRRPTSPGEVQRSPANTVTTYSLPTGAAYYYDAAGGNLTAARSFAPSSGSFAVVPQSATGAIRTTQVHGILSGGQPIQFNPVMVVEQKRPNTQFLETGNSPSGLLQQSTLQQQQDQGNALPSIGKVTSSPRPSILRKRDNEGSTLKAAKNLAPILASLQPAPESPLQHPSRPESRDNGGNTSGGSTTISATSSPDLGEHGDDSLPLPSASGVPTAAAVALKLEQQHLHHDEELRPSTEMSARKKPRKQQLIGNDEPKFNIDDMQFLSENKIKKENDENVPSMRSSDNQLQQHNNHHNNRNNASLEVAVVKKPAPASLLNSYRQTWKSTHNHYLRYTDVKPKDERRPTIIDLANQNQVLQKINGWKIHHLSAQMEDMSDLETQVYNKLSSMLELIETKDSSGCDKEFNRINELIKGNMQRSKIINDSTVDAKSQVMKIFEHREHVSDIITRCASKRNFKKREKF